MDTIKQIILKIMDYHSWTQKDLAKKLGVARSQVSRWLSDKQKPNGEAVSKIYKLHNQIPKENQLKIA